MGICDTLKKEASFTGKPITKEEINELFSYEPATCKIKFEEIKNNKKKQGVGTGFFCELNDNNIPFKKALFTNNHILDSRSIEIGKEIELEYLGKINKIKITKDRKVFTNKELDYTCIEILDIDKYNYFFKIDNTIFEDKTKLKNTGIFILQYPNGGELSFDKGIIIDIEDNRINHNASTEFGSSGSPLIKRYQHNLIIGIHCGNYSGYNIAFPFNIIINDIKNQLNYKNNNIINEYKK